MQVSINNTAYEIPFDPAVITLGQFTEWQKEYGANLDKKLRDILETKYEGDEAEIEVQRTEALNEHLDEEAICWYSFWTRIDLHEVKDQPGITPFLERYRVLRHLLREEVNADNYPEQIQWKNENWVIQTFLINPASEMSFNEIITSKEVMRQVHAMGGGKWDGLPYLCAVYFRKEGELFSDELIQEGSERMKLLKELPLQHAIRVSFFLTICANTWSKTLAYSAIAEAGLQNMN